MGCERVRGRKRRGWEKRFEGQRRNRAKRSGENRGGGRRGEQTHAVVFLFVCSVFRQLRHSDSSERASSLAICRRSIKQGYEEKRRGRQKGSKMKGIERGSSRLHFRRSAKKKKACPFFSPRRSASLASLRRPRGLVLSGRHGAGRREREKIRNESARSQLSASEEVGKKV